MLIIHQIEKLTGHPKRWSGDGLGSSATSASPPIPCPDFPLWSLSPFPSWVRGTEPLPRHALIREVRCHGPVCSPLLPCPGQPPAVLAGSPIRQHHARLHATLREAAQTHTRPRRVLTVVLVGGVIGVHAQWRVAPEAVDRESVRANTGALLAAHAV
ncbi:hypothetical protein GCM10023108_29370 [Saccharopolyspora hordei]